MPTDIQYKDQLRKDRIDYEIILKHLKKGETNEAIELVEKHIERIDSSLQD